MRGFDRHARSYDQSLDSCLGRFGESSTYFRDYKAAYAQRVLKIAPEGKILDFGCGIGNLASELIRRSPSVVIDGYDPSAQSIEAVPSSVRAQGIFTSDIDSLPRSAYAVVLVSNVLHHVHPDDRPEVFRTLHSLLCEGGLLLVFEHNPLNPATRWIVAHCAFDEDAVLLWPSELRQRCRSASLAMESIEYIAFFPSVLSALQPLERALGWCPAGAQYAAVARRTV